LAIAAFCPLKRCFLAVRTILYSCHDTKYHKNAVVAVALPWTLLGELTVFPFPIAGFGGHFDAGREQTED